MAAMLSLLAAAVATGFLVDLGRSYLQRPRPHIGAWSLAIAMYALATWMLFVGLVAGWNPTVFKTFYYFGAIVNVPFLALGSLYLVVGPRAGRIFLWTFLAFALGAAVVTVPAGFVHPLPVEGLPSGREVFPFMGPRIWALVGNVVGSVLLVGLAIWTIIRVRAFSRRLVVGNWLIVFGVLAPAAGGTIVAFFGEAGALALSLLVGAALLWAGYRVASGARRAEPPPSSSPEAA